MKGKKTDSNNVEAEVSRIGWGQGHKGVDIGTQDRIWVVLNRTELGFGYIGKTRCGQRFQECMGAGVNKTGGERVSGMGYYL